MRPLIGGSAGARRCLAHGRYARAGWRPAASSRPGGRSCKRIERVKLAETLAYESVYITHLAGRSRSPSCAYALATTSIRVGTGVVPIHAHTPATMAQDKGHDRGNASRR